jgi:hypothetical protein
MNCPDEPRAWRQDPRLCVGSAKGSCEPPTVGMAVRTLELSDIKDAHRAELERVTRRTTRTSRCASL